MSDISSITSQLANIDLSTVETSFPVLAPGVVNTMIAECEEKDAGTDKPYVNLKYTLTQEWKTQSIDGKPSKPVQPGYPVTERIYVKDWVDPKTNEVKNFGIQQLAKLREAIFGPAKPGDRLNLAELIGQPVTLRLKFDLDAKGKDGKSFGPQTSVQAYVRTARAS